MLVTAQSVLLIIKGEKKKILTLLLTFMVAMGLIWCACGELSFLLCEKGIFGYFPIGPKKKKRDN